MQAREYLSQVALIRARIDILKQDRKNLHEEMRFIGIHTEEKVQSSRKIDRFGTIYARIDQRDMQIAKDIEKLLDLQKKISEEVRAITNDKYMTILYRRYIRFQSWEQISADMFLCTRQVLRLHVRALEVFQETYSEMLAGYNG